MDIYNILIYLVITAVALLIFFFWLRRKTVQDKKEKLKELQEDFKNNVPTSKETDEDKKILDEISQKIKKAAEEGSKTVEIHLDEGYNLNVETPDVISLQTPRNSLYKSFRQAKLKEIEQNGEKVKLHLR